MEEWGPGVEEPAEMLLEFISAHTEPLEKLIRSWTTTVSAAPTDSTTLELWKDEPHLFTRVNKSLLLKLPGNISRKVTVAWWTDAVDKYLRLLPVCVLGTERPSDMCKPIRAFRPLCTNNMFTSLQLPQIPSVPHVLAACWAVFSTLVVHL